MRALADILVQSPDHTIALVAEVKTKMAPSVEWASQMRRNLYAHLSLPPSRFFLLALPERFFLWKDASPLAVVPPDYQVDAREVLGRYAEQLRVPLSTLSEASFELLVRSWLEDLISANLNRGEIAESLPWVVESGLYDAIKHGSLKLQASA